MVAITTAGCGRDRWGQAAFQPVERHDLMAVPGSARKHELTDLQQIMRQQAQARRRAKFDIPAFRPVGGAETHRIEQNMAAIIQQRLAGALSDQATEKRGRAAAVTPSRARLFDDRPL